MEFYRIIGWHEKLQCNNDKYLTDVYWEFYPLIEYEFCFYFQGNK